MIKKLILENFQKHEHLELDFATGVNVIYGKTDIGKSCIRRALSWIFFNEPKGEIVRKQNTKKTSVKVTLDNDIVVERIKSATINAYILYVNGEERRFDAVGKDIPEEVLKVLKMIPIIVDNEKLNLNIAEQIALPFLLDKPATFRSKLFNKLTGSDIVDKSLQSLNKDILHINKVEKIEKESLIEKQNQIKEVTNEKDQFEIVYEKVSKIFNDLKIKQEKYELLKTYLEKLDQKRNEIKVVNEKLKLIKVIDVEIINKLKANIDKLRQWIEINTNLKLNKKELEDTNNYLNKIKTPEINIENIRNKVDKFNRLNEISNRLYDIRKQREKIIIDITKTKTQIETSQIEYKEILKKIKVCPLFKKECPLNKELK